MPRALRRTLTGPTAHDATHTIGASATCAFGVAETPALASGCTLLARGFRPAHRTCGRTGHYRLSSRRGRPANGDPPRSRGKLRGSLARGSAGAAADRLGADRVALRALRERDLCARCRPRHGAHGISPGALDPARLRPAISRRRNRDRQRSFGRARGAPCLSGRRQRESDRAIPDPAQQQYPQHGGLRNRGRDLGVLQHAARRRDLCARGAGVGIQRRELRADHPGCGECECPVGRRFRQCTGAPGHAGRGDVADRAAPGRRARTPPRRTLGGIYPIDQDDCRLGKTLWVSFGGSALPGSSPESPAPWSPK